MPSINLRFGARRTAYLARAAEAIVERTRDDVLRRLTGLNEAMSAAEIRGYVRVRAASIVHREVARVIARDRRLRPADQEPLAETVSEQIARDVRPTRKRQQDTRAA